MMAGGESHRPDLKLSEFENNKRTDLAGRRYIIVLNQTEVNGF